jgi:hypothetical protein
MPAPPAPDEDRVSEQAAVTHTGRVWSFTWLGGTSRSAGARTCVVAVQMENEPRVTIGRLDTEPGQEPVIGMRVESNDDPVTDASAECAPGVVWRKGSQ